MAEIAGPCPHPIEIIDATKLAIPINAQPVLLE
jgi:hypothetical protein